MANDLDGLKQFLTDYVNSITRRSKGGLYDCPLPGCSSGTGAHKTGAFSITKDGTRWKCFSCNAGGDLYDLVAAYEGVDASEATRRVLERYGTAQQRTPARQEQPAREEHKVFTAEIMRYHEALAGSEGETYLQGRGLTVETMQRFKLGYDAARRMVTIPYNPQGSYYCTRSTKPDASKDERHRKLPGVPQSLFNAAALYSSDVCFVVESPLCAISIAQEGGAAVALSGTDTGLLVKQLKKKPTNAALVICLDNDEPGQKAKGKADAALAEIGVFHVDGTAAIMGEITEAQYKEDPKKYAAYRKDPNDVLRFTSAEALREAVAETAEETRRQQHMTAQEAEAERQQHTGAGMVDTFLQDIQTRKYEPMPTGITDIDRAIGGGFIRQQIILLGAAPGAGKTALAQWIFEGMAKRGTSCVYLNLEMSREQILARSFARIAAAQGNAIRTTDILQGYKWTDEQRAAILAAAQEYKETIAPRMIYNPDGVTANLDSIIGYIEGEAQRAEKAGAAAPCVVLDYLQIVSGDAREDAAGVIQRTVMALKGYAMKHNTVVFVIIAHNRNANRSGEISMESGRDTSALEYSADLYMGLTFTKCLKRKGQDSKSPDELTEEERREVTLRILKGRFGGVGREVDLYFNGETMTYTQTVKDFIPVNVPTPFDKPKRNRF